MYKLYLLITLLFLTGCMAQNNVGSSDIKSMGIDNQEQAETNKILMVIAPQLFRDQEYTEPRKIFEENGIEVSVASIQGGKAIGAEGTEVNIDLTVSEVSVEDFEAVVFIGGPGMAQIIDDESLQVLAKKFYNAGKLTAAICVAPSILAKAGIFDNKRATVWADNKDDLIAGGADYTGESVTIDGKIITADGPSSAKEFGEKIAEALK